jgi:peptidoglycan biosynthesis protein MviN/MurJ (putative lipid II flippase)
MLVPACGLLAGASAALVGALPDGRAAGPTPDELVGLLAAALLVTPILAVELFLGRGHLARGDARTPFWAALGATTGTVSLDFLLVPRLGPPALFLGRGLFGLAACSWLARRLAGPEGREPSLAAPLVRPLACGMSASLVSALVAEAAAALAPPTRLAASLVAGSLAGLLTALVVGPPDPHRIWERVRALAPGPHPATATDRG